MPLLPSSVHSDLVLIQALVAIEFYLNKFTHVYIHLNWKNQYYRLINICTCHRFPSYGSHASK